MNTKINFYYEVAKESGFGEDENGNPSETYLKIGFNLKKPLTDSEIESEYKNEKSVQQSLKAAAEFIGIDESLLRIITEEEYFSNTDDEYE